MFSSRKLLSLEVVLCCGPDSALQLNRIGREVGKGAVWLCHSIKEYPVHLLFILFTCEFRDDFRDYVYLLHEQYLV